MALTDKQVDDVVQTLTRMAELLGLSLAVKLEENGREPVFSLDTPEPGRLIGRRGRTLDSIQYLLTRIMSQRYEEFPKLRLDVTGGDRPKERVRGSQSGERSRSRAPAPAAGRGRPSEQTEEKLHQQALDIAKEVKRWGDAKVMGPLTAGERAIVHQALADDPQVVAESGPEDENGRKKITIRAAEHV